MTTKLSYYYYYDIIIAAIISDIIKNHIDSKLGSKNYKSRKFHLLSREISQVDCVSQLCLLRIQSDTTG